MYGLNTLTSGHVLVQRTRVPDWVTVALSPWIRLSFPVPQSVPLTLVTVVPPPVISVAVPSPKSRPL